MKHLRTHSHTLCEHFTHMHTARVMIRARTYASVILEKNLILEKNSFQKEFSEKNFRKEILKEKEFSERKFDLVLICTEISF